MSDELLKELIAEVKSLHATIGIMQQDINHIRYGEYDSPSGANTTQREPLKLSDITKEFNTKS